MSCSSCLSSCPTCTLNCTLFLLMTAIGNLHLRQFCFDCSCYSMKLPVNGFLSFLVFSLEIFYAMLNGLFDFLTSLLDGLFSFDEFVMKTFKNLRSNTSSSFRRIICLSLRFLMLPFSSLSNSSSFFSAFTKQSDR